MPFWCLWLMSPITVEFNCKENTMTTRSKCRYSIVLVCTASVQSNTCIAVKAMLITLEMDALVNWLTVSWAAVIVQLHHSLPMYEHMLIMMNFN